MVFRVAFTVAPEHIVGALSYLNTINAKIISGDSSGFLANSLGLSVNYMWHTILCEIDDLSLNIINIDGFYYIGQQV